MGYEHRIWKSTCGNCHMASLWHFDLERSPKGRWTCKCGALNQTATLSTWPEVPRLLHLGVDHGQLLRLYPALPEDANESWAQPYSVRSFLSQASRSLGGCIYKCERRGELFGETIYTDTCAPDDFDSTFAPCAIVDGWSAGRTRCALWEAIAGLCQTDDERRFLQTYLRYVKHRQFPMLLPQTRVGIAERRRADFVAYVPVQYWRYHWIAIELDAAHPDEKANDDRRRDQYYSDHSYQVISLRPKTKGYLEEVRSLVEQFEVMLNLALTDPWEAAVELKVLHCTPPPPF